MAKSRKKSKTADAPFAAPAWPKHVGDMWPLNKIKPYANNPRSHPSEQIALLANLMTKYGPDQPIVVDEKGVILKGHGRLMAAKQAGFEEFPVVQHLGRSEEEKRAIRIADNQVALLSDWNPSMLQFEIGELKLADFDLGLLGFSDVRLEDIQAFGSEQAAGITVSLQERFGIVPFSVFNAREGYWQDRKRAWLALGIQSEVGRGENLLEFSDAVKLDGKTYKERAARKSKKNAA